MITEEQQKTIRVTVQFTDDWVKSGKPLFSSYGEWKINQGIINGLRASIFFGSMSEDRALEILYDRNILKKSLKRKMKQEHKELKEMAK